MLINGDSTEELKHFPNDCFDAVISDPPYDFDSSTKEVFLSEFMRVCKGPILLFCPPENQWSPSDQYLFWVKPFSTKNVSKNYSRFVEIIQVYRRGTWNTNRHWSNYLNVFEDRIEEEIQHPYQKPLSLMERLVLNHTNPGDLILDPFCGIATTGTAATKHGRRFIGIEKEKEYFDIAQARLSHAQKEKDTQQNKIWE